MSKNITYATATSDIAKGLGDGFRIAIFYLIVDAPLSIRLDGQPGKIACGYGIHAELIAKVVEIDNFFNTANLTSTTLGCPLKNTGFPLST